VRFAVVLYGGVSLAIYINGVVQELFRLVRATSPVVPLPEEPTQQCVYFPSGESVDGVEPLRGSERVYRKLGQLLPLDPATDSSLANPAPLDRRPQRPLARVGVAAALEQVEALRDAL
jgi:hypothetical protein